MTRDLARSLISLALLTIAACVTPAQANVTLPRLVSDGMVLQRDKPITLWGWADENERVTVRLAHQTLTTRAKNGRWQLKFAALKTGPGFQITIQAKNRITIHNVLAGDVWIAAGQSNMELPINRVLARYPDIIQDTHFPEIREFSVPTIYSFKGPQEDFPAGQWKTATPENLGGFSAVGFFYARSLYERYHVPIGLISLAVGGSPAEAWMSVSALAGYPHYLARYKKFGDENYLQKTIADDKAQVDAWYAKANAEDLGLRQVQHWSSAELSVDDWKKLTVPGKFGEQQIDFTNGVIWLRKNVFLTEEQLQTLSLNSGVQAAKLFLGAMVDGDEVYVNGQLVGQTSYQYPPRIYPVRADLLHAGENSIVIRLTSYSSAPGFVKDKTYALQIAGQSIGLEGEWRYRVGMRSGGFPTTTTLHYQPVSLFNAELSPTFRTAMRGVIWYQGESNTDRSAEYETLFPALIRDWRAQFRQGKFPFLFVQLANFMEARNEPAESAWAQLRQAQRDALSVPNTGMAVAIDLGEWNDIHPLDKLTVGERLALLAEKLSYGEHALVASGPLADSVTRQAHALLVHFSNEINQHDINQADASALVIHDAGHDAALSNIAVAGTDRRYYWAKAQIVGRSLLVWSEQVPNPASVRYAWADNPAGANLYNAAGLPAAPFELSASDADDELKK